MKQKIIITCEHATNQVPTKAKQAIKAKAQTHFAYDLGAKEIAQYFAKQLKSPLFLGEISRLVTDLNRSPNHKKRWGELSHHFTETELAEIEKKYYLDYREKIFKCMDAQTDFILHLSIHSFTPELNGEVRNADLGLLFDPARQPEIHFAKQLQKHLKETLPEVRVRRNYPYLGKTDGLVSCLRKRYSPQKYAGIEIEFNQGTAIKNKQLQNKILLMVNC